MSLTTTAKAQLEVVRDRIPTEAYDAIAGALLLAEQAELRSAPGREATASELARRGAEFRRQPHLSAGLPEPRIEAAPRDDDPTAVARAKNAQRESSRDGVEYGRARLIH